MVATEQNYHKITSQPYAMHIPSSSCKCACSHYIWDSIIAFDLYCTSKLDGFLACLVLFGTEIAP